MKALVLTPEVVEAPPDTYGKALAEPDLVTTKERGVALLWELGETDEDGKLGIRYATLTTAHDKDRKRFYATLRNVVRAGGYGDGPYGELTREELRTGRYVMERTSIFDAVTILTEPVARYGAKAMAAFNERALNALRIAVLDTHEDIVTPENRAKVLAYFDEAATVTTTKVELIDLDPAATLAGLQAAVGGYIEPIVFPDGYEAYGHDEAKLIRLPANPVATAIWEQALIDGEYGEHLPGDYIAGPIVVVGPLDDEGDTQGLTDEAIVKLAGILVEAGVPPEAVAFKAAAR